MRLSDKDKSANVKLPEMIDYATGAIVVDMVAMNDWFGDKALQSRQYFDMLFSFDGTRVERLPAKQMYWPEELRLKYSELKTLEKKPKEPWRAWSSAGVLEGRQRAVPGDRRRGPMDRGGKMEDTMPKRGAAAVKSRVLVPWAISGKDNAAVFCDKQSSSILTPRRPGI